MTLRTVDICGFRFTVRVTPGGGGWSEGAVAGQPDDDPEVEIEGVEVINEAEALAYLVEEMGDEIEEAANGN